MVVGFTTTCAIRAYHHYRCEFESRSGEVHDTTLCDKVCQLLATDRWFSPGTPVSSTNKTDRHDITEILLKVALNNINQTKLNYIFFISYYYLFLVSVVIVFHLFMQWFYFIFSQWINFWFLNCVMANQNWSQTVVFWGVYR